MVGDVSQKTGNNSHAYQAKGNMYVTNGGMDYQSVKQLCLELISENFPKLAQEAMNKVNDNVLSFGEKLDSEINSNKKFIDESKLADPDVQAALNDAVQGAAKKGDKADLSLLAKLITSRLTNGNSDLLDIAVEEAIRITTKLTAGHINYLSVKHFLTRMFNKHPNVDYHAIERFASPVLKSFGYNCSLSRANIEYLAGLGVLNFIGFFSDDIYEVQYREYPQLAADKEDFKKQINDHALSLGMLLKTYESGYFPSVELTTSGQIIALMNLKKVFGENIDLKIWIN